MAIEKINCVVCKKRLPLSRTVYCSSKCVGSWNESREKICDQCGEKYTNKGEVVGYNMFCSFVCQAWFAEGSMNEIKESAFQNL